jgi:hypothetical protein
MNAADLVEIELIKQLKARYFRSLDEKRWDDFGQCFCEDATLDTRQDGAPIVHGRAAIQKLVGGAVDPAVTVHHGHMPEIDITGPTSATGVWSMEDYLEFPGDPPFTLHGRGHYHEQYTKGPDGAWRIQTLRLTRLWVKTQGTPSQSVLEARTTEV